jgi:hypothetical protein
VFAFSVTSNTLEGSTSAGRFCIHFIVAVFDSGQNNVSKCIHNRPEHGENISRRWLRRLPLTPVKIRPKARPDIGINRRCRCEIVTPLLKRAGILGAECSSKRTAFCWRE